MTLDCTTCRDRLSDLASGELGDEERAAVTAHLGECVACRRAQGEIDGLVRLLGRVGPDDEELPDDFAASLHRKLVAAGPPPRPSLLARLASWLPWRPIAWSVVGALATLLILVATHRIGPRAVEHAAPPTALAEGTVPPTFHVPARKLAIIKIDFEADAPEDDVAFAITLPDGLHFVSSGRELPERSIEWQGRLDAGSNLVPVAVRGSRPGLYTVAARVSGPGIAATQQVVLEVIPG